MSTDFPEGADDAPPLTILLADDSGTVRASLRLLLTQLGHIVETAADGSEAVATALHRAFDIILMDVQMPVMGGLEATSRIRREVDPACQPRIIGISAEDSPRDRARCLDGGMNDFLVKPILAGSLVRALERWRPQPGPTPEYQKLAQGLRYATHGTSLRIFPELA
jgi:CheY-like chemotaxis protein